MTMKDESRYLKTIDFFMVEEKHAAIHARLENWARYVANRQPSWVHPMWKQGKSNLRAWQTPVLRIDVDTLDGHKVEKAIYHLGDPYKGVLRWAYVYRYGALRVRRELGLSEAGLWHALSRGRSMVKNTIDG